MKKDESEEEGGKLSLEYLARMLKKAESEEEEEGLSAPKKRKT